MTATGAKSLDDTHAIIGVPTFITGYFGMNVPYPGFSEKVGYIEELRPARAQWLLLAPASPELEGFCRTTRHGRRPPRVPEARPRQRAGSRDLALWRPQPH
jgi:hypothetical protein